MASALKRRLARIERAYGVGDPASYLERLTDDELEEMFRTATEKIEGEAARLGVTIDELIASYGPTAR